MAYFAAAQIGLALAFGPSTASAVWPPAGIALAALVVLGPRMWPGVMLGVLVAEVTSGVPLAAVLGITAGNTIVALLGAWLLLRVARMRPQLARVRDVLALAAVGVAITAVGAVLGTASLWLGGAITGDLLATVWSTWWLGDVGGVLIVAPLLLVIGSGVGFDLRPPVVFEAIGLLATTAVASLLAFSGSPGLEYLVFPALIWASLRFQVLGAATTSLVVAGASVTFAASGVGPFAGRTASDGILASQLFVTVMSLGGLLLAAVVSERASALAALRDAQTRLEEKVRRRTSALATANEHLLALATHDGLTGLANRALFFDRLERAISLGRRHDWEIAVLFVDIDAFKHVNDTCGHQAGDDLLVETAARLRDALRDSDTVARLGGDEFAVLLGGDTPADEGRRAAQRVLDRLRRPVDGLAVMPLVSASIGVVAVHAASGGADDGHEILRRADAAMYEAKAAGGNRYAAFERAAR